MLNASKHFVEFYTDFGVFNPKELNKKSISKMFHGRLHLDTPNYSRCETFLYFHMLLKT